MKRGVSSVVGVLVLISVVVILAGIVAFWSRGFILDKNNEVLIEKKCNSIDFISGQFCKTTLNVDTLGEDEDIRTYLEFDARSDRSNITGFSIIVDFGGDTFTVPALEGDDLSVFHPERIVTGVVDNEESIESITIIPKVEVNNAIYYCEDKSQIVNWGKILEC